MQREIPRPAAQSLRATGRRLRLLGMTRKTELSHRLPLGEVWPAIACTRDRGTDEGVLHLPSTGSGGQPLWLSKRSHKGRPYDEIRSAVDSSQRKNSFMYATS
jgi:hypothetical protein